MAKNRSKETSSSFASALNKYSTNKELNVQTLSVDVLNDLWGGGVMDGYMYSIWAEPGCGKTTLSIQTMKSYLKDGKRVLFIDVEKAMNEFMINTFGLQQYIDDGLLIILTVSNFAEWEDLCVLTAEEDFGLVITDSMSALQIKVPKGLTVEDVRPGLKSAQMSFCMTKIKDLFYKAGIPSIVIFHARANIDITGKGTQASEKQEGGFAAGHIPDVITKITTHSKIEGAEKGEYIGVNIRLVTTKNKFCPPFKTYEKKLIYGIGISKRIDLVDTLIEKGLITMAGAGFFTLPDGSKIRGTKNLYDAPAETMRMLQATLNKSKE